MTKKFYVAARETRAMSAIVEVPDDWTLDDLRQWYEQNGASGEFKTDYSEWSWDWDFCDEADDNQRPDLLIEPVGELS